MTPTDLETFLRQRYNAVGDSYFSQAEIFNYFWAAQTELANETHCIQSTYSTTSVASQRAYALPSRTVAAMRVEYDGRRIYPNDFTDDDSFTGNYPDEAVTGIPTNYQVFGTTLYLRPLPNLSSKTIKIYSYDMPDQPTAVGTISIPSRYQLFLIDYGLYCMFAKDKNFQMAEHHLKIWGNSKTQVLRAEEMRRRGDEFAVVKDMDDMWDDARFA